LSAIIDHPAGLFTPPEAPLSGRDQCICLIGLMGTGKTTIGRLLSIRNGFQFIDADDEVVARAGYSVAEMFARNGVAAFRALETTVLEDVTLRLPVVFSTGGGVVVSAANRELLKSRATVVHLTADVEELWQRIQHDTKRPLLNTGDPLKTLSDLQHERLALYRECADFSVETGGKSLEAIVDTICTLLSTPR